MQFEWDSEKDRVNRKKHGVRFDLARRVFEDPNHLSTQDRHEDGEERWQTLGLIGPVAIFLVAHTIEDGNGEEVVGIISARKADKTERRRYDERT